MANGLFSFVAQCFRCDEQSKRKKRRFAIAIVCAGESVPELLFRTEIQSASLSLGLLITTFAHAVSPVRPIQSCSIPRQAAPSRRMRHL